MRSTPARSKATAPGTPKRAAARPTLNPRDSRKASLPKSLPGGPRLAPRGEIARGGMGVVHKVFDTRMERTTALKVIDPRLAGHADMVARFFDEARITGLLDHPNIVPVHDVIVDDLGRPTAMMMKLVDGETLTARISSGAGAAPRTERELTKLLEVFLKICDAVAFAHSRGVIHRDLKPDNIMIGEFGQVYVMDWGCALVIPKRGGARRSLPEAPGTVIGTPGYMAPEQAWGKTDEIDERTDVFGLGGILYHILTGTSPHPGDSTSATIGYARVSEPRPPQDLAIGVRLPPGLCRIAMRAIATEPDDRFESVAELRGEIEAFLRGGSYFDSCTFPAGTVIVKEGDAADVAYVITAGTCEAFRKERGRRVTLRTLGPGDVFGEGAIFAAGVRNASVGAVDDVTAIVVSRESLHEELALDSWMGSFVRALAIRYRDLESRNRVQGIATDHLRVTSTIIEYMGRTGMWCGATTLGASWSRLWGALGGELRLPEEHVLELISRTPDLAVDAEADTITLSVPA